MPLAILITGALGKMGTAIAEIVLGDPDLTLVAALERPGHPRAGDDYGLCIGKGPLGIPVSDAVETAITKGCVVIDFSSPQSTRELLEKSAGTPSRFVIGTTGLTDGEYSLAKKTAEKTALLVSPNMSLGVNLLFSLTEIACSRLQSDFDIEIIEAHHRFKKDAPSGTARRLGEIAAQAYDLPYDTAIRDGRSGMAASDRPKTEVGMHAVRGGDIVGDHTVLFAGIGERLELKHCAHSRSTFARGAVKAAKWIAGRGPGYYSMRDVLGL